MERTGIIANFEPTCKVRFLTDEIEPNVTYVAITEEELISLIADQMKLIALESGGVDNWEWYGESIGQYRAELPDCYGDRFWQWVHNEKATNETAEEFADDLSLEDFARFEVEVM